MFPGIADRMNKEITARAPTSMKVKVRHIGCCMYPLCCKDTRHPADLFAHSLASLGSGSSSLPLSNIKFKEQCDISSLWPFCCCACCCPHPGV